MQKRAITLFATSLMAMVAAVARAAPPGSQAQAAGHATISMPSIGSMAPDFTLKYFDGNDLKDVSLSQYRGKKNVVVAFYIFAFTGG
jgi:hypothetical protein